MNELRSSGTWVIILSLFIAMIFNSLPLPGVIEWGKPHWVVLVVVYWVIALPHRVGVTTAWFVGLFLDILNGTVIGQHALALPIIAYFTFIIHLRVRVFPIWQQCLTVFVLVGIYQVIVRVVQGMLGSVPETMLYWLPSIVSALLWPWLMLLLRYWQHEFRVS
ncbi:MAG: rod shape-determining protein MreD [Pseudomonadales bacterium]|nr:rod shape-determining protein MreD [Pseudomonadales bacterium]